MTVELINLGEDSTEVSLIRFPEAELYSVMSKVSYPKYFSWLFSLLRLMDSTESSLSLLRFVHEAINIDAITIGTIDLITFTAPFSI